ncbi:efflux RND transporter permease subunit [Aureimonas jatrophae]|uniref:Multidrug efflux pump subunit AcrB n=1 Tax=Aureimonas jatrophae TaxID=1166073 RepID=A0A1H0K9U3_9HYPH|nr:efflux RND transporter permease subunit [Aureimonas jatrophae]MBB3951018.1 multidrug efflux pump subunit AcrB [Aureimonas jatrophae]SDO52669.1 Multidrug efflux pump subunit AcrB [Aureimonas jatrophae]
MNVSAWAIRHPLPTTVLFVVLTALGLLSFRSLPITYFPTIDVPLVTVTIGDPGAAPEDIETAITQRVEDAVASLTGIEELESVVEMGRSVTTVEFELSVPIDRAVADVRDAVASVRSDFPSGIDEPVVARVEAESGPVVTYAVADPSLTREELSFFVDDVVTRELRSRAGIGRVERIGGVDREIQIRLDPDRLLALDVTASQVNAELGRLAFDAGGGTMRTGDVDRMVSTVATLRSLEDLEATAIRLPNGSSATLGSLGTVIDTYAEPDGFGVLDGTEVVGFSVLRARGASDVGVADVVDEAIGELLTAHPTVRFSRIDDSVTYTLGNYHSALKTLAEGSLLAMVVVFLFLRDWRATAVAAVALPLAIVPTFWAMQLLGFSLNIISLLGITLVAGILVDDAIVEIENIERHGRMGKPARQAAIDASAQIGLTVTAIAATIIAVFMPVGFMSGVVGQYFREFGLTVAIAVFFSLLVARLVTPLLAVHLMRFHAEIRRAPGMVERAYASLLRIAVTWRGTTVAVAVLLFAGSLALAIRLPTAFLPDEDNGKIQVSVELPAGSSLDDTRSTAETIRNELKNLDGVGGIFIRGGTNASGQRGLNLASLLVILEPKTERALSAQALTPLVADALRRVPDIGFEPLNSSGERDVSVSILSRDGTAASEAADAMLRDLAMAPFAVAPASSETARTPEIRIRPDIERMANAGVTTTALADTVRVATVGAYDDDLAEFIDRDRRIPIRLQLERSARDDLETLRTQRVPADDGRLVPLAQLADVDFAERVSRIERRDRERRIDVAFDTPEGMASGPGMNELRALVAVRGLPAGVRLEASGDSDTQGNVFSGFASAMGLGIGLVFVVLVLLFGSVVTPVTILVTLPLSLAGVVAALMLTGTAVSLPVVIGILMLMGIVTKNAIMLLDFAQEGEREGLSRAEASVAAGRERARPIVMTTLAMVAGMVPAALALGEGGDFRAPMAIAVIGGLVVSTLLSLVVVPALHTLMGDASNALRRVLSRIGSGGRAEASVT